MKNDPSDQLPDAEKEDRAQVAGQIDQPPSKLFRPNYRLTVDVAKKNEEHHRRVIAGVAFFIIGLWLVVTAATWIATGSFLTTVAIMAIPTMLFLGICIRFLNIL